MRVNDPTSTSNYSDGVIELEAGDEYNKWTIAHEIGHWVMDEKTDAARLLRLGRLPDW